MRATGLSQHTLEAIREGRRVRSATIQRVVAARRSNNARTAQAHGRPYTRATPRVGYCVRADQRRVYSVWRGAFHAIDHEHLNRAPSRLELKPELLA